MIWLIIAALIVILLGLSGQEGERSAGNSILGAVLLFVIIVLLFISC